LSGDSIAPNRLVHDGLQTGLTTMVPRLSVFMAISLDGFIADESGGVDWLNTLSPPGDPEEDLGYAALIRSVDALVMGRSTLDMVLGFGKWPYGELPIRCLTNRPPPQALPPEANIIFESGSPAELMERWHSQGLTHIYLDGGRVVQDFLRADLIADMNLTQVPALLGKGIPLFVDPFPIKDWHHEAPTVYDNGFVQRRLKRKRAGE